MPFERIPRELSSLAQMWSGKNFDVTMQRCEWKERQNETKIIILCLQFAVYSSSSCVCVHVRRTRITYQPYVECIRCITDGIPVALYFSFICTNDQERSEESTMRIRTTTAAAAATMSPRKCRRKFTAKGRKMFERCHLSRQKHTPPSHILCTIHSHESQSIRFNSGVRMCLSAKLFFFRWNIRVCVCVVRR